jgi:hypothetical protein
MLPMPKRLFAVIPLCLAVFFSAAEGGGTPTSTPCTARIDEIRVDPTAFDHYTLRVKTVLLGSAGECDCWIRPPGSTERQFHLGKFHCSATLLGNPVWVALDLGPYAGYGAVSGTREFFGTGSGQEIAGTG